MRNLSLAIGLLIGSGITGAVTTYTQSHRTYSVVVAGSTVETHYHSLVAAIDTAHLLYGNPETEQEKSRPVLVLDENGRLIDTIAD